MPVCWRLAQPHHVEKVTGLQGARSCTAFWNASRVGFVRCVGGLEAWSRGGEALEAWALVTLARTHFHEMACGPLGLLSDMERLAGLVFSPKARACQVPDYRWIGLAAGAELRGLWLVSWPPQFCLLAPSLPWLVHPRDFSRSQGPPSFALLIYGTYLLPSQKGLRGGAPSAWKLV